MKRIDLSILILTHNRPKLFERCLNSVLKIFDKEFSKRNLNIEILVNNDSNDIKQTHLNIIKYYNYSSNNLGNLYKFLFEKAKGKYIYFLEDDDYLLSTFFKNIKYLEEKHDLYFLKYINYQSSNIVLPNYLPLYNNDPKNDFQLSQLLFKKDLISLNEFPCDNSLDNDWKLYKLLLNKINDIEVIQKPSFKQTCDGKDNISFPKLNKDIRWNLQNNMD